MKKSISELKIISEEKAKAWEQELQTTGDVNNTTMYESQIADQTLKLAICVVEINKLRVCCCILVVNWIITYVVGFS